ncbi:hypothetical protein OWV82_019923 [Melia azedarach]|uniref:Uncharacterized protein n=1 Tax=Melia azedarach TaxID=155640 RepID=A0ACC1X568_MELAZ|nr:hypothetical protein OWV82_019923 [Melia azedarach]
MSRIIMITGIKSSSVGGGGSGGKTSGSSRSSTAKTPVTTMIDRTCIESHQHQSLDQFAYTSSCSSSIVTEVGEF